MTAKEYLQQVRRMDRLINNKIAELEQLRTLATSITAATDREAVQTSGVSDKVGNVVASIVDLQNEINALVDTYVDKRKEIIAQIDGIEKLQPLYYAILHGRYIQFQSLQQIADNEGYTAQYMRKTHGEALEFFKTVYTIQ